MRWEQLDIKDRAKLMRIYLNDGISSIASMREHYNKLADGGEAYIAKKAEETRLAALKKSRALTEPVVPLVPNPLPREDFEKSQEDIQKFVRKKTQSLESEGRVRTIPSLSSQLKGKTYYADEGAEGFIKEVNNPKGIYKSGEYQPLVPGQSCMSTASGVYCKSVTGNQTFAANPAKYGFKRIPNDEVLPGDIVQVIAPESNIPKHAMIYDSVGKDNEPRYNYSSGGKDKTSIVRRGKYPAPNDKLHTYRFVGDHADSIRWREEYNRKALGGPLRDEYDNPEQYYDYNTAEEVGGMYDEKSKHWASRDPRTGMILKNPKHPTFAQAIKEDQSSGYAPFIDISTGRYFTLRPEEYSIAPNKHTLRRANIFQGGGLKDEISYQTPERQRQSARNNGNYWGALPLGTKAKALQYYGKMGVNSLGEAIEYYNSSPEEVRDYILKESENLTDDLVFAPYYSQLRELNNDTDTTSLKYSMRAFRLSGIPDTVNASYHGNTVEESGGNFYRTQLNNGPGYGRDQRERWTTEVQTKNGKKVRIKKPNERWLAYVNNTSDTYTNDDRETIWSIGALTDYTPGGIYKQEWNKGKSSYKSTKKAQQDATAGKLSVDKNSVLLRQTFFRPASGVSDDRRKSAGRILETLLSENQRDTSRITKMP